MQTYKRIHGSNSFSDAGILPVTVDTFCQPLSMGKSSVTYTIQCHRVCFTWIDIPCTCCCGVMTCLFIIATFYHVNFLHALEQLLHCVTDITYCTPVVTAWFEDIAVIHLTISGTRHDCTLLLCFRVLQAVSLCQAFAVTSGVLTIPLEIMDDLMFSSISWAIVSRSLWNGKVQQYNI